MGAETAENLCLDFGCRGKRNFAKVSSRVLDKVYKLRQGNADHTADDAGEDEGYPKFVRMFHGDFVFETGFGGFVKKSNGLNI